MHIISPKPEPKSCTKPSPFQLESLARHEEEMQRELEERRRKGIEEEEIQCQTYFERACKEITKAKSRKLRVNLRKKEKQQASENCLNHSSFAHSF
ncbi:hypothetical protein ACS0TY_000398 [Phlomoides rotata]